MFNRTNLLIVMIACIGAAAGFALGGWLRPLPPINAELEATGLKVGDAASPVALPDVDGQVHTLDEWKGRLLVVNFWASWCAPCRKEMPLLDRTQERLAAQGVQVIGIAADNAESTQAFLKEYPVRYPILVNDPMLGADVSIQFGNARSVLPYTVLIGRDGRIVAQRIGDFNESDLNDWLQPHL